MLPGLRSSPGCGVSPAPAGSWCCRACNSPRSATTRPWSSSAMRDRLQRQLHRVLVKRQRRNRRAIRPLQIVPAPARPIRLVEEVAVVAHHAAFNGAHARLLHLLRQQFQRPPSGAAWAVRRRWRRCAGRRRWRRRLIRIMPRASASDRPTPGSKCRRAACRSVDRTPATTFVVQVSESTGSSAYAAAVVSSFSIRCRNKKPALIQPIQRLPIHRGHADAELRMTQRGLRENGVDRSASDRTAMCCGRSRRVPCRPTAPGQKDLRREATNNSTTTPISGERGSCPEFSRRAKRARSEFASSGQ